MITSAPRASLQPFLSVLVPMDFSEGSTAALDRALKLPFAPEARLEILHVLPSRIPGKVRAKVEAAARESLRRAMARARGSSDRGLDITSSIARGEAYVGIIHRARDIGAELIVVGRHGRRPLRDLFLGTTADGVIRMGDVPVLVVRDEVRGPYRRALVATDLEDTSCRMIELALRVLGSRPSVKLVHAAHVPFEGFMATGRTTRSKVREPYRAEALSKLASLVSRYQERARWRTTVRFDDARFVVPNEAIRSRAEVIVVGTHGRSGLFHTLIGSVARDVIANAPCDVLIARPARFTFVLP